jgi:Ala-tRNA(Pro) deacylase
MTLAVAGQPSDDYDKPRSIVEYDWPSGCRMFPRRACKEEAMATCLDHLKSYLDEKRVNYEVLHHREVFTMPEIASVLHEKGAYVAKVFMAWVDGRLLMLVLPAHAHVDFNRVKSMLSATSARRAREDEFADIFPDCEVGAMPPFGNLYNLQVYIDHALTRVPHLVFQAGSHREAMMIPTSDYLRLVLPMIGDFTQQPKSAQVTA